MIRLHAIAPPSLAERAHEAAVGRAQRLAWATGHELREHTGLSDVRLAVHQLAHYAVTGEPPEGRVELVHEYMISVAEALGLDEQIDEELRLVLVAAEGRSYLHHGHDVAHRHLAALAGVSKAAVTQACRRGDGPQGWTNPDDGRDTLYAAEDARRWLSGRGVRGLVDLDAALGEVPPIRVVARMLRRV